MTSYKKIFAYSSIGCVVAGVICGAGLTYKNSNSFDTNIEKIISELELKDFNIKYESDNKSMFSKKGRIIFQSKNQQLKDLAISFTAKVNPIECSGEFFIPEHDLLKDNLNKYRIEKINFDFGLTSSELMFDVKNVKEPIHYTMDGITFLTDSYTGLIELKNSNKVNLDDLILTIGSKAAIVKFAYDTWQDTSFSIENVTYSAPIETFMRTAGDFHAPKYSHLKVEHLDVVKSVVNKDKSVSHKVAQSFNDVQLYRRMQHNGMEANGLKFDVGNKMGSVVIEGVNTPVNRPDFELIDIEGKYQIKLSGIAFDEKTNVMTKELSGIGALQKNNNAFLSDVVIQKGEATFNKISSDVVANKLIQLNILSVPERTSVPTEGVQGKAPSIKVEESK